MRYNKRKSKKNHARMEAWRRERELAEAAGKPFTAGDAIRAVKHRGD